MRRFRIEHLTGSLIWLLLGTVIVIALSALAGTPGRNVVLVDMKVQNNTTVEMFWNADDERPGRATIQGEQRTTLEFALPPVAIYRLRLDPTQNAEEEISIYSIVLRRHDGTRTSIPLDTLRDWFFINTTTPAIMDGSLRFRSTSADPYFFGPVSLPAPSWLDGLAILENEQLGSGDLVVHLVLLGTVCAFFIWVRSFRAFTLALIGMVFTFCVYYGSLLVLTDFLPSDTFDVSQAVGRAALKGLSVSPSRWATILTGLAAAMAGIVCGRLGVPSNKLSSPARPAAFSSSSEPFVAGILFLAFLLAWMPDLNAVAHWQLNRQFSRQWDANNIVTWAGLVAEGKRPYRDFWYPYGGFWIFDLPLLKGALFQLIYHVALYGTFGIAVWRLVGQRVFISAVLTAFVLVLSQDGMLQGASRYLLSLTVTLSFVAIDRDAPLRSSGRLWFWVACALALWGEPAQLLYAAPAVVIAQTYAELRSNKASFASRVAGIFQTFAVLMGCMVGLVVFLVWQGELDGFIASQLQTAAVATFGLLPTSLWNEFEHPFNVRTVGVFAPYALLLIGACCIVVCRGATERRLALATIGLSIVSIMLLQKHLVRRIDLQLLAPVTVGALLMLVLFWQQARSRIVVALVSGALVGCIILNVRLRDLLHWDGVGSFQRMFSTVRTLIYEPTILEAANRAAYSEQRFSQFRQELAIIDKLRSSNAGSFYVLGDLPILHLFLPGPIPFHFDLYSASPIEAQVGLQQWLRRTKPEVVVVDPNSFVFDDVQMVVRVPLIAQEIISNYVPYDRSNEFTLLRQRSVGQEVPLGFWSGLLGSKIDYGYLLRNIRVDDLPSCKPETPPSSCLHYLEVSFDANVPAATPTSMPISVGRHQFEVAFVRIPGMLRYLVPIDRIWFWQVGQAKGLSPVPTAPPGTALKVVEKMTTRPILY
jgi:hypothetical protein